MADEVTDDERIDGYVVARQRTRKMTKRVIREWPFKVHHTRCCRCSIPVIVASSTIESIADKKAQFGEEWRVICDDCVEQVNLQVEDPTEAQLTEIARLNLWADTTDRRN